MAIRSNTVRERMDMHPGWQLTINAIAFQGGWLACVIGGNSAAIPAMVVVVGWHLLSCHNPRRELRFVMQAAMIGLTVDLILVNTGLLQPASASSWPPLWLLCLWPMFATTIGYPLRIFLHHRHVASIAGFCGAPLSYAGGATLAEIELMQPLWQSMVMIGSLWAALFPFLLSLYQWRA